MKIKDCAKIVNRELKKLFPRVSCSLIFSNPLELLIATMLSAQCTDKMVNQVTRKLFVKYRTIDDYLNADQHEFEQDIRSTGFFRTKTKNILTAIKIIKKKYSGNVPDRMEQLLTLPGIARKTANVILSEAFNKVEGIAVDTHVRRLSKKFGLTNYNDPVKIEADLMKLIPKRDWKNFSLRMIEYGRKYSPDNKAEDGSDAISIALFSKY